MLVVVGALVCSVRPVAGAQPGARARAVGPGGFRNRTEPGWRTAPTVRKIGKVQVSADGEDTKKLKVDELPSYGVTASGPRLRYPLEHSVAGVSSPSDSRRFHPLSRRGGESVAAPSSRMAAHCRAVQRRRRRN